jgi:hypothetical protein
MPEERWSRPVTEYSPGSTRAKAMRCSVAIREAVRTLGLETRAGLRAGEYKLIGNELVGLAIHIGAWVAAKAGASEVLVSSTVKELVSDSGFKFRDRGMHTLKGVSATRERYRRHLSSDFRESLPILRPIKDRIVGWTMLGSGGAILVYGALALLAGVLEFSFYFAHPRFLFWLDTPALRAGFQAIQDRPLLEVPWGILEFAALLLFFASEGSCC